jgi:hypothetical protein
VFQVKYKVGDKVRVRCDLERKIYGSVSVVNDMIKYRGKVVTIAYVDEDDNTYKIAEEALSWHWWSEEMLEPVVSTLAEIKEKKLTCCINVKNIAEAQFLDDFFECKSYLKKYCENAYKERMRLGYYHILEDGVAFQLTDGVINDNCSANFYRSCGGRYGEVYEFSDLFPVGSTMMCGGKIPTSGELIVSHTEMERAMDRLSAWATNVQLDKETVFNGLSQVLKRATEVYSSTKEEKNLKFTFYTTEGYRIDKSNNTRIPIMTTEVLVNGKDYQYGGSATCDKTDYSEREGVLNAIANAVCGGNFDREFNKVIKNRAFADKKARTCAYCGQFFDTVEEKQAHEAWHVERRKARHERYLLRKRAKEIAFEEQAQKMAKEMIKEDK